LNKIGVLSHVLPHFAPYNADYWRSVEVKIAPLIRAAALGAWQAIEFARLVTRVGHQTVTLTIIAVQMLALPFALASAPPSGTLVQLGMLLVSSESI
jgi:hypothetical protein